MRSIIVLLLAFSSFAGAAPAQDIDWDADNFGFFFDTGGTLKHTSAEANTTVPVYLVIIHPTFSGTLTHWALSGFMVAPFTGVHGWPEGDGLTTTVAQLFGGGVDTGSDACYVGFVSTHCYEVACAVPVDADQPAVLAEFLIPVDEVEPLGVFHEAWQMVVETAEGETHALIPSTRWLSSMPPTLWRSATINSDIIPVADQSETWGAVKALFR